MFDLRPKPNERLPSTPKDKKKRSQKEDSVSSSSHGKRKDRRKDSNSSKTLQKNDPKHLKRKEEEFAKKAGDALKMNGWYHGLMPREEIEEMLHADGDFIVRRTEVGGKTRLVVSVMNRCRIRHILLMLSDGKWSLRNLKMRSITALIDEHVKSKIPVQPDGTMLQTPIPRPDYYILHDHVLVKDQIGAGAFGDVHIGVLTKTDGTHIDTAIKMLKGLMTKRQRSTFMKEAKLMRRFNHPNIVNLLGVAPQEDPVMILLEVCPNGSLNKKLKYHLEITPDKLISYSTDAARGMCYLSACTVIHRDIAARNCLIGVHDEAKISDFGLSVADQDTISVDKLRQMPVRWLSPETLRLGQFSTKTDVWSFGVMLWEIFIRCRSDPYPGLTNAQARAKILSRETPMMAPDQTPPMICDMMNLCFTQEPAARPNFADLLKILSPTENPPEGERRVASEP